MRTLRSAHSARPSLAAWLVAAWILAILAACTATQPASSPIGAPGFWRGIWHGMIAPVTFVAGLFIDTVRIYASPNAGWRYDLGFMVGIGGFSHGVWRATPSIRRTTVIVRATDP